MLNETDRTNNLRAGNVTILVSEQITAVTTPITTPDARTVEISMVKYPISKTRKHFFIEDVSSLIAISATKKQNRSDTVEYKKVLEPQKETVVETWSPK